MIPVVRFRRAHAHVTIVFTGYDVTVTKPVRSGAVTFPKDPKIICGSREPDLNPLLEAELVRAAGQAQITGAIVPAAQHLVPRLGR
jgi:hypothetical protein